MRPGSYFINLGRGGHVIESDLEKAIDSGRLAGAMLDVFASEPLSPKSSFWKRESVLITPHISGVTLAEEASDQIISNICLIESGQPPNGVVDRTRGY
jgi:glyoxylate/hydroxypyruvate reductase A